MPKTPCGQCTGISSRLGLVVAIAILWPSIPSASTEYTVTGALDYVAVQRTITAYLSDDSGIEHCLKGVLQSNPHAQGGVAANFEIGTTGAIRTATIETSSTFTSTTFDVETCVAGVMGAWKFPAHQTATTTVSYVFDPHYFWVAADTAGNINLMASEIEWSDVTGTAVASAEISALGGAFTAALSNDTTSNGALPAVLTETSDAIAGSKLLWFMALCAVFIGLVCCRDINAPTKKKPSEPPPPSL